MRRDWPRNRGRDRAGRAGSEERKERARRRGGDKEKLTEVGEGGEKQKWWDMNLMRKENEKGDEKETWSVKKKKE